MALLSALLGACTVGEVPGPGGGTDGSVSADITAVCSPRAAAPTPAYQHVSAPTGPRSGMGCVTAGCHGVTNPGGSVFAFAGTIYKAADGATPAPGVTIHIFKPDTTNAIASAITDSAGNFRIAGAFDQFPYKTLVSGCGPATPILPMVQTLGAANDRNCSSAGCHGVPGGIAGAAYLGDI